MKKYLLLAFGLVATAAYAQQQPKQNLVKADKSVFAPTAKAPQAQLAGNKTTAMKAPRKAEGDNVLLYSKPAGTLYSNWNKEGRGYGASRIVVTPWQEYTFENLSTDPETTFWKFMNPNTMELVDANNYRNEDYSYSSELEPGYYSLVPFLFNEAQTESFAIAKASNYYWADDESYVTMVGTDSVSTVGFLDDHQSAYGWGSMEGTGYLYGTGTITDDYGTGTCLGFIQEYPKPCSPLYVEDIYFNVKSQTGQPLADGVALTLYIVSSETDETIATMTATNKDLVDLGEDYAGTSSYAQITGEFRTYRITFAQVETDDFGFEYKVPVVIDEDFYIQLMGFDQAGVELGMNCQIINPEDTDMSNGLFIIYHPEADEANQYKYYRYGDCALPFSFTAILDNVLVPTSLSYENDYGEQVVIDNTNMLLVSNDGTQQGVDAGDGSYLSGVYVYTAQPWFGSEGEEFYFNAEDLPDWITMLNVDNSPYADYGYNLVNVSVSPLPAGVTGRSAKIHIMGRGKTSDNPIIIVQGEVSLEELGIADSTTDGVKASGNLFNMAGQKLSTIRTKGIMLKDGKKFIVK